MIGHDDGTADSRTSSIKGEAPIDDEERSPKRREDIGAKRRTISLDLKDADIHDVMRTFAKLTNTDIVVDMTITGQVSESLHEVPWTEALDKILGDANLRQERVGNAIHIHRK